MALLSLVFLTDLFTTPSSYIPDYPTVEVADTQWFARRTPLPMASPVVYSVHSPAANFGKVVAPDDTLVVVLARDLFIGCYNFEKFLSTRFETLFVFDEKFADLWKMEDMVLGAGRDVTLGAHLAVANGSIGEQSARRLSLDLMNVKFDIKPELVFSCNCDTHPIPKDHAMYETFEQMTTKLADSFKQQKRLRASGEGALVQGANITREYHELYAMNTLLYEWFPNKNHLLTAAFHGRDWWNWNSRLKKKGKPQQMVNAKQYWMTPINDFVEAHAMMFDREKMEVVGRDLFITDSIPSEPRAVGALAAKHGWSIVRNNEVNMYQNFAPLELRSTGRYKKLNDSQMEYMKLLSFELMSKRRNPKISCDIVTEFDAQGLEMLSTFFGAGFVYYKYKNFWAPKTIQNSMAGYDWTRRWIDAGMRIAGWKRSGENDDGQTTYEPEACIPATLALTTDESNVVTKGNVFLRLNVNNKPLSIVSWHPYNQVTIGPDYPKSKRVVVLPLSNQTIVEKAGSPSSFKTKYGQSGATCMKYYGFQNKFNE